MSKDFILSCESTADINYDYFKKRNIPVLFYNYQINGKEFEDNMGRDSKQKDIFYSYLENGMLPTTSQINEYTYYDFFNSILIKDKKILHIAFGSGMTPSVNNAIKAANKINEEIGEEKILVVDSTCSSGGYGLLMLYVNEFAENGKSIYETKEFAESIKYNIHHQFFSTDMKFFKRSGRVNGITAGVATMLGICPIMHLDCDGKIIAYDKVRGKKRAIEKTIEEIKSNAKNGCNYSDKCIINHSNCLEDAITLKTEIEKEFSNLKNKIEILDIGNIIASHCGPGTVAVYFLGNKRI